LKRAFENVLKDKAARYAGSEGFGDMESHEL
jgi:hypothetical protein